MKAMSAIAEAKNEWGTKSAQCGAIRRPFRANWPLMDAPCLLKPEQVPARHEEVCQRGDDEQPIAGLRIHRFDQGAQHRPRHDTVHLGQKRRAARRLAVLVKATCRERHLFHRFHPCVRGSSSDMTTMKSFTPYSEFP